MKRIALSGYYGFGNAGDEAVLAGLIRAIRGTPGCGSSELSIDALSIDPARTRIEHGIESSNRYKAAPLIRAIARCDLLASGGGSLLQDVTSPHSIFYYLGIVRAAQIMGKRTMFIAQGIGPLERVRSIRLTASVANRCDAISVRDADSAALLAEIGVSRPPIVVTADPALLLSSNNSRGVSASFSAAVSLRAWPDAPAGFPSRVARAYSEAIENRKLASVVMNPSDVGTHAEFFAALETAPGQDATIRPDLQPLSWEKASSTWAAAEIAIGMRLHALILAAANGIPSVALSYDPKVAAFMKQTEQEDAVFDIRDRDVGKLALLIRKVWDERHERSRRLLDLMPALRASATRNAEIAASLLCR